MREYALDLMCQGYLRCKPDAMKKIFLFLTFIISASLNAGAQIYMAKEADISFFSASLIENIEAHNTACKPVMNTATQEILFKVPITSFKFSSALMQEHFNENYMESDKFSFSSFAGKIQEKIDFTKDGQYEATATGMLLMHGVSKQVTATGTVTVKGSQITIKSVFKIRLADFDIKVPSLYIHNIAEEVEIRVDATLIPFVKS